MYKSNWCISRPLNSLTKERILFEKIKVLEEKSRVKNYQKINNSDFSLEKKFYNNNYKKNNYNNFNSAKYVGYEKIYEL